MRSMNAPALDLIPPDEVFDDPVIMFDPECQTLLARGHVDVADARRLVDDDDFSVAAENLTTDWVTFHQHEEHCPQSEEDPEGCCADGDGESWHPRRVDHRHPGAVPVTWITNALNEED